MVYFSFIYHHLFILNFKRIFSTILLTIVLFGLPVGSWFYLHDGLRYRKERLAQLSDFDRWGATSEIYRTKDSLFGFQYSYFAKKCKPWQYQLTNGKALSLDSLKGCIRIVHGFDPASPTSAAVATQLERVQKAFGEDRTDIKIISLPALKADSASIMAFMDAHNPRADTWYTDCVRP
jgi:hypothetical protein